VIDAQMPIPGVLWAPNDATRHSGVSEHTPRRRLPPKSARPETISQARTWDTVKHKAMHAGLCEACASQYAWGCQIGFSLSKPPCPNCQPVVDATPTRERPNGWRTMHSQGAIADD
jgi:hypothetical protein